MPSKKTPAEKIVDVNGLAVKAYELIVQSETKGLTQNMVWKMLGLSSRDGSRLVTGLEKRGLIKREKVVDGGRWTYKLIPVMYPAIVRSIETIPCTTCELEPQCKIDGIISPITCPPEREGRGLADWVLRELRALRAR